MPRGVQTIKKQAYKPVQKGQKFKKFTSKTKIVNKSKGGKTEFERLMSDPNIDARKERLIKQHLSNQKQTALMGGAEGASTTVAVSAMNRAQNAGAETNASNITQNVNGGIKSAEDKRAEEEEEGFDYPGINS